MEFQYNTIKEVLYRKYNRAQILISKWITMFLYSIYWIVLTYAVTFILKIIFFPKFDLGRQVAHGQTFITMLIKYVSAEFLTYWLLLSLVLLMANLFKSSAVATTVGIVGYFMVSLIAGILTSAIQSWEWVKWNPLTMLMYPEQIIQPGVGQMTKLSLNQLFAGNVIYLVIFLILGYLAFARRNV
ncbi:ABC transporter permease subunit [Ligilactobacillus pobuzihii]|uniref:ABC transporter permease subunit n=1 Tax=Ligilactobacillus pobuzihii TaxID=449659 RepID=UPI001F4A0749|nr:ABC transporter permease subunit [Ligilactobacillus pobuzihii]